ncbi:hypothetical protein [Kozakia baliensis]|nr:hypothetical protein [Kozakia baliensis]
MALLYLRHSFGHGTLRRFFVRHWLTPPKKTSYASEQDRPDILSQRQV